MAENLLDVLLYFEHNVSLSNRATYNTSFKIDGLTIVMVCDYNIRAKKRLITLYDTDGNTLLKQTFVVFGRRCELNFNATELNLDYYVTLKPKGNNLNFKDYDYINWADDFTLCFIGGEQEQNLLLKENLRKVLTGN